MLTEKEFLQEIAVAADERKKFVKNIVAHGLPIFIFGAGNYAKEVTDIFNAHGVKIDGYLVDEQYYTSNTFYLNRPIYSLSEIFNDKSKNFVVIRGLANRIALQNAKDRLAERSGCFIYEFIKEKFYTLTYDEIISEKDKFFETYSLLSDDTSRQTFMIYLKAHLSLVPSYLESIFEPKEYFNELTRDSITRGDAIFVDCGAYNGDSVEKFIDFVGGNYKKIFAFEPDNGNFIKLQQMIKDNEYKNIVLCNCGVWDKKETLKFNSRKSTSSFISEDGNTIVNVDSIDNIVGGEKVTFIKMDVEGAELKALNGAIQTLERSKPTLAISVYHRKEDLITIPQFIKSVYKDARFYLREHRTQNLLELDLYVIP